MGSEKHISEMIIQFKQDFNKYLIHYKKGKTIPSNEGYCSDIIEPQQTTEQYL
ncbi:MAG: hypothetical protein K6F76_03050 [Clostridiales bacterium]|nr:hypothetical protein [Clostridiales bacterium]